MASARTIYIASDALGNHMFTLRPTFEYGVWLENNDDHLMELLDDEVKGMLGFVPEKGTLYDVNITSTLIERNDA